MDDLISHNLLCVQERIRAACLRVNRDPKDIRVLLATKTVAPERLTTATALNYKLFGENTLQELIFKQEQLTNSDIEWHFIGALQSKKAKEVIKRCTMIHSLDRLSLAQELQKRATEKPIPVLIEVNSSGEETKSGLAPEDVCAFAKNIESFNNLIIAGVMTLAAPSSDTTLVRQCFRKTKDCFVRLQELQLKNAKLSTLSMGMSNDFEMAIEEGSTLIRLGSIVFGPRL
ncbi:MAG: YggS family pyridoxal phosphate-dependent enzyme [Bdellovibrionaceae bacterium]|nr:YggS family pyridoxal phosphate-dependent enzyme [Pseudobdellovibrionaceae bacterium]